MSDSLFKNASRNKFRYESVKGLITTEDLWDMPLVATTKVNTGFDLDTVAKSVSAKIKLQEEESFVKTKTQNTSNLIEQLDIVKYIIAAKLAEQEARSSYAANQAQLTKLTSVLNQKQDLELLGMSTSELEKRIALLQS